MNRRLLGNDRVRGGAGVQPVGLRRRWRRRRRSPIPIRRPRRLRPPRRRQLRRRHPLRLRPRRQLRRRRRRPISTRPNISASQLCGRCQRDRRLQRGRDRQGHQDRHRRQRHQSEPCRVRRPDRSGQRRRRRQSRRQRRRRPRHRGQRGRGRGAQRLEHDGRRLRRDDRQRARRRPGQLRRQRDGCTFFDNAIAAGIDAARLAGAKVINLSLGGSTPRHPAARRDAARGRTPESCWSFPPATTARSAKGAIPTRSRWSRPSSFPASVIIAGSVGVDSAGGIDLSQLSDFSNRAGTGAALVSDRARLSRPRTRPDRHAIPVVGHQLLCADDQRRGGAAGAGLPQPHRQADRRHPVPAPPTTSAPPGVDSVYGHGRLNIAARVPAGRHDQPGRQPDRRSAGTQRRPAAGGRRRGDDGQSLGAIILDGYSRAYVLNLAKTLRQRRRRPPAGARAAERCAGRPAPGRAAQHRDDRRASATTSPTASRSSAWASVPTTRASRG